MGRLGQVFEVINYIEAVFPVNVCFLFLLSRIFFWYFYHAFTPVLIHQKKAFGDRIISMNRLFYHNSFKKIIIADRDYTRKLELIAKN